MITKRIALLLVTVSLIPATMSSQFRFHDIEQDTTFAGLQAQVRALYGQQFDVYYAVFDSMIGNIPKPEEQEAITDPYGTLRGAVLFWAVPPERDSENRDSVAVGFFKGGSIIWSSLPIYKGGVTQIFAARDLNHDGEVDIITLWSPSSIYDHSTDVRIISWNGRTGRLISDEEPDSHETKVVTTGSMLQLIRKPNGIYDLRAYWTDQEDMKDSFPSDRIPSRPWVVYTWNGTKYVLSTKRTR
jgi:hypothetical protein